MINLTCNMPTGNFWGLCVECSMYVIECQSDSVGSKLIGGDTK